jgi:multidrug efflux pump subunit AcrA (membrane-fusion protein)
MKVSSRHAPYALFVIAPLVFAGCNQSDADSSSQSSPTVVVVSPPVQESVADYVDYTGRTESAENVEIRSRVTGFLKAILFKDGAEVVKDSPLYLRNSRRLLPTKKKRTWISGAPRH